MMFFVLRVDVQKKSNLWFWVWKKNGFLGGFKLSISMAEIEFEVKWSDWFPEITSNNEWVATPPMLEDGP